MAHASNAMDKAGETPLHCAARAGSVGTVRALLATAAATAWIDVQSKKGDTPLILARCWGHGVVATVLLEAGADETLTTKNGWDAAKWAAWFRKKDHKKDQARKAASETGTATSTSSF